MALHDFPHGTTQPRVHILIFTWNKADLLKQTLVSLSRTMWSNYKVIVLNNGSSDDTEAFLHTVKNTGMFPEFRVIDLPVNVGAPAARNWLAHEPENRFAEYICYFDDDVIVEPDWLVKMVNAAVTDPTIGVVGAKIINADGPKTIQHSGGILTKPDPWIDNVLLFSNLADEGQFDNLSQRDYVMGCVNLYRRTALDAVGDFDIQFSPTQFDDVDHHLRMRLSGWKVMFDGRVEIRHFRASGGVQNINHIANRYKFANKYTPEQARQIIEMGALQDFIRLHPWVMKR